MPWRWQNDKTSTGTGRERALSGGGQEQEERKNRRPEHGRKERRRRSPVLLENRGALKMQKNANRRGLSRARQGADALSDGSIAVSSTRSTVRARAATETVVETAGGRGGRLEERWRERERCCRRRKKKLSRLKRFFEKNFFAAISSSLSPWQTPTMRTRWGLCGSLGGSARVPSRRERGRKGTGRGAGGSRGGVCVEGDEKRVSFFFFFRKGSNARKVKSESRRKFFDLRRRRSPHSSLLFEPPCKREEEEKQNELPLHQPARRALQGGHHPAVQGGLAAGSRREQGERGKYRGEVRKVEPPKKGATAAATATNAATCWGCF